MNNINQLMQHHAYLKAKEARRGLSQQERMTLQRIESTAQANLTPQELQQAQHDSNTMQAMLHREVDLQDAMADTQKRGYYAQRLSEQVTGFSPAQFEHIKRGEAYPINGNTRPSGARQKVESFLKDAGIRWSYSKFDKFINEFEEKVSYRGEEAGQKLIKERFGEKAAQMSGMVSAFQESGLGEKIALSERYEKKDTMAEPTPAEIRRAGIVDSMLQDGESRKTLIEDEISEEYAESEFRHGDIARAMQQHEREEEREGIEQYEPESYDITESA